MPLQLLFPGVPGGPELIVLFLIMAVLTIPLALVAGAYLYGKRRGRAESSDGDVTDRVE